jgi:hypothetical protein
MNFPAAADEFRRQEFSRLSAAVTPRIEAFRSMTGDAFSTEIALMFERLGQYHRRSVSDIVTTRDRRKYVTACATPTENRAGQGSTRVGRPESWAARARGPQTETLPCGVAAPFFVAT